MKVKAAAARIAWKFMCILAVVFSSSAHSSPIASWRINPEGTGADHAMMLSSVDVGGAGFVQAQPNATWTAFDFVENGAYQLRQADRTSPLGTRDLTVAYQVRGSFSDTSPLSFSSGFIDLYADSNFDFGTGAPNYGVDNGIRIARFNLLEGGLSPINPALVTIRAILESTSLLPGYLFSGDGTDLSGGLNTIMELNVFNEVVFPDSEMISGVICGLAAYDGPGCDGTPFAMSPLAYAVRDGGFATISTIPEPSALWLVLAGFVLLNTPGKRRRRATLCMQNAVN